MQPDSKPESLWSEVLNNPWVLGGVLVCFIAAIVAFFTPRVVGLLSLALASALWLLALVMAKSLRGRPNRWVIIGRAWLICAGVFALIAYAGVRWGAESWATATRPKARSDIARTDSGNREQARLQQPSARDASMPAPDVAEDESASKPTSAVAPPQARVPQHESSKDTDENVVLDEPVQASLSDHAQPAPLPLKQVEIASQGQVNPTKADAPFATKIVVTTTAAIQPTWLALACNAKVMYADVYMNQGTTTHVLVNLHRWRSQDGKTIWLSFTDPAFLPETPLVLTLSGRVKIVAQSVDEGRPPADAKLLERTGLQIVM